MMCVCVQLLNEPPHDKINMAVRDIADLDYFGNMQKIGYFGRLKFRDVIRSPDIRTFESRSEVRTQFQHPEVRIKY